jgi:hypothetical protein
MNVIRLIFGAIFLASLAGCRPCHTDKPEYNPDGPAVQPGYHSTGAKPPADFREERP